MLKPPEWWQPWRGKVANDPGTNSLDEWWAGIKRSADDGSTHHPRRTVEWFLMNGFGNNDFKAAPRRYISTLSPSPASRITFKPTLFFPNNQITLNSKKFYMIDLQHRISKLPYLYHYCCWGRINYSLWFSVKGLIWAGVSNFFCQESYSKYLRLCGPSVMSQLLNLAIVAWKQPLTMHKWRR